MAKGIWNRQTGFMKAFRKYCIYAATIFSVATLLFSFISGCSEQHNENNNNKPDLEHQDKSSPTRQDERIKVRVTRVVDGDTFEIEGEKKVRLIGVDTPETVKPNTPVQPYGKEASEFTKKSLLEKNVSLEKDVSDTDRYGRLLRYVYLEDGTFYNEMLVREGYARVSTYPPDVKHVDLFLSAERYARENDKGLWGLEKTGSQEQDTSNGEGAGIDKKYIGPDGKGLIKGNINSKGEKIYHMPGQQYYDKTVPEEWFSTEKEAINKGYRKSKR